MINEFIPSGSTLNQGRVKINTIFSGSPATLASSGLTFENVIVNNNISGGTFYSGTTELRNIFGVTKYSYTSSTYDFVRTITDSGKVLAKLTIKNHASNISVDIAPKGSGYYFRFQEFFQATVIGGIGGNPGSIRFNHLIDDGIEENFSIDATTEGESDRLSDYDFSSITYVTNSCPQLTTSAITMTYIPPVSNYLTGYTKVFIVEGIII